jgi:hypothetical protein
MIKRISPIAGLLLLAGCTTTGEAYPSLAPRPVEGRSDAEPVASVEETPPADAALAAQIARTVAEARKGEADFDAAYAPTQRSVNAARNAAVPSETWVAAQAQLSVLDAARAPTAQAMAQIDGLYTELIDRAAKGEAVGGIAEVAAAQAEIEAIYTKQVERLDILKGVTPAD